MRYRQPRTTGTRVSVLSLGAMTFGEANELSAELAARLDAASIPELGYPYDFIKGIDGAW